MARKIFAQNPEKFIPALAEALKEMPEFEVPLWAQYVKSGVSRERPPMDDDFWFVRAASILRQLYVKGVVGVGKLRTRYGSKKDRGTKPDKFYKAGGKIIRVILQQAEAAGLVEKVTRMQFGRRLTQKGRDLLDSIDAPYDDIETSGWIAEKRVEVEQDVQEDFEDVVEVEQENTDEGEKESTNGANKHELGEEKKEIESKEKKPQINTDKHGQKEEKLGVQNEKNTDEVKEEEKVE